MCVYIYIYKTLKKIYSSADGLIGCFYILANVNDTAIKKGLQMSHQCHVFNSFGYKPRKVTARWYGSFSTVYIPPTVYKCSNFFTSSPTLTIFFYNCHPSMCKVIFSFVFTCIPLIIIDVEHFSHIYWPFVYLLWGSNCSNHLPIFISDYSSSCS